MNAKFYLPAAICPLLSIVLVCQLAGAQSRVIKLEGPPVPMSESPNKMERMAIHVISSKTGEPLEGVQLIFTGRVGVRNAARTLKTNAEGKAEFVWSSGLAVQNLRFSTKRAGYALTYYTWPSTQGELEIPTELEVKLEPATKIGGIVQDENKQPIDGRRFASAYSTLGRRIIAPCSPQPRCSPTSKGTGSSMRRRPISRG